MSSPHTLTRASEVMSQELPREPAASLDLSEPSSPPPSMSMSSNTHTSATSPPSTPPRGRSASRYPATLGRVPLHRRGTSRTYERLEDLLREAGYKETRVFTPEGEHDKDGGPSTRSRVGSVRAVVGFLAGLVSSRNPSLARDTDIDDAPTGSSAGEPTLSGGNHSATSLERYSPPPSPLAHAHAHTPVRRAALVRHDSSRSSLATHTPLSSTDSPSASPRRSRWPPHISVQAAIPPHLRGRHSSSAVPPRTAHAYLRHMASAASLQPQQLRPSRSSRSLLCSQPEEAGTPGPRRTWANGLVPMAMAPSAKASSLPGRASPRRARTPLLCLQVQAHRATRAEGTVSCTRVVCRSAPGSRSSSRAAVVARRGKNRQPAASVLHPHEVPSLARTRTENDGWSSNHPHPNANNHPHAYDDADAGALAGVTRGRGPRPSFTFRVSNSSASHSRSMSVDSHRNDHYDYADADADDPNNDDDDDADADADDSDGEDGELDLNRLLVPPRRQYSIRSLRQHLHFNGFGGGSGGGSGVGGGGVGDRSSHAPPSPRRRGWDAECDDAPWGAARQRCVDEEDEEGDASRYGSITSFARPDERRKRGLPGSWAQWNS